MLGESINSGRPINSGRTHGRLHGARACVCTSRAYSTNDARCRGVKNERASENNLEKTAKTLKKRNAHRCCRRKRSPCHRLREPPQGIPAPLGLHKTARCSPSSPRLRSARRERSHTRKQNPVAPMKNTENMTFTARRGGWRQERESVKAPNVTTRLPAACFSRSTSVRKRLLAAA